jgi:Fe-S-cluster containining protein
MPAPNPAARNIFAGCESTANNLIADVFTHDRTPAGLMQAVAGLNAYADDSIEAFQADYRAQGGGAAACQAGCAYCCHGPVHLTPLELLNVVLYVASPVVSIAQRTAWGQRIEHQTAMSSGMTVQAQIGRSMACPFLLENQCSIYAVRPMLCRGRNAFDSAPCQAGFADPTHPVQFEMLQEQTLEAEQKKYALGASTIFVIIQYQRDLAQARSNEVAAVSSYAKAKVQLEEATGSVLDTYNISIDEAVKGRVSRPPAVLPAVQP